MSFPKNEKSEIEQKKLFFKTLVPYMDSCKITDKSDKDFTHTTLGDRNIGIYSSKYKFLPEHKDYFYELYASWVFDHNCPTFLTEKHHPEFSPVLIDLDFRYSKNNEDKYYVYVKEDDDDSDDEEESKGKKVTKWKRKYNIDNVIQFLEKYFALLDEVLEIQSYQKVAYIMEKSSPVYDKEKKIMKDGIHIMMPYLVSAYEPLFYVRQEILKDVKLEKMFQDLGFENEYSDIVDEAVIQRNNWFMYGSCKPGKESYKITNVVAWDETSSSYQTLGTNTKKNDLELVKLLSVYDFEESNICQIKENTKFQTDLKKIEEKQNKPSMNRKVMINKTSEDLKIIQKLVSILSPKRADNFDDWIRLGWCLHNIDYTLCDSWDEFSSQSKKYKEGCCRKEWETMDKKGLELGSLHRWAKKDSPDEYRKIIREDLTNLIKASLNQTDYDIAKVVHKMLKHEFVCVSSKNKVWFQFKNHRWIEIDNATELRRKISEEVVNEYCNLAIWCNTQVMAVQEEDQRETLLKRGQVANKISLQLRKESFKNNVLSSCATLFHDGKFLEKLDSNVNLIGFENGVYDLENSEFREGFPEDYISFSTKIEYHPMNKDDKLIKQVHGFLTQVLPIPAVKDYVLKILGSVLSGKTGQEKFHIWTGCHSKGTKVLRYDGLLDNVENINVGDYLMGPDSKPREVKNLVRGNSLMYKIQPCKGNSFIVNEDHIIVLKATNIGSVIHSSKEHRYKVSWQEKDMDGYPISKCQNFPYKHSSKKIYRKQTTYYDTKEDAFLAAKQYKKSVWENNKNVIKNNDIVEMPLSVYLQRKNKIGVRNYYLFKVPISFNTRDIEIDPYLLGYWLGDGNSGNVEDTKLLNEFKKYNLINNKHIPENYKINSRDIQLQLLAGIIDSDGHYNSNCNHYEITLKQEHMIDDLLYITRSLGFASTKRIKTVQNKDYYNIIIYGNDLDTIPVKLSRKLARPRIINKDPLKLSFSVERLEEDEYYGFTLDEDHLYLTEDFIVHHNCGGNGKSKIIELFELAFGDYCGKLSVTNVTQKRPASNACSPELLKNKGKRFVTLQEPDDDEQIHVGAMKELTGGDKIQARGLFKDPIEFKPQWKIVMTSNILPNVSANDNGTWRRIRVTEFISRFMEPKDMKQGKKYQFPIDYDLSTKLELWPEAFMQILIQSYHDFIKHGLQEPQEVLKNTEAYKEESDCMLQFVNECLEESLSDKIKVDETYQIFKEWFKNSGNGGKLPNKKDFKTNVSNSFGNPDSKNYWRGVTFVNSNEDEDDEEEDN